MSDMNLVGANQWQTLQMQESSRPMAQPQVRVPEPDLKSLPSQQPGVQTPTQTAQAVRMEPIFDHVDLSLKDSLGEHAHGGEERGEADAGPAQEELPIPVLPEFASLEEACDWLCALDHDLSRRLVECFHFSSSVRGLLASLAQAPQGKFASYARQSTMTASGHHLLARTLHEVPGLLAKGRIEDGGKLLAILLGAAAGVPGWAAFLELAMREVAVEESHPDLAQALARLVTSLGEGGTGATEVAQLRHDQGG